MSAAKRPAPDPTSNQDDAPDPKKPKLTAEQSLKARIFAEHEFTDAVVKCRDKTWQVHKVELAKNSEYFYNAFKKGNDFVEGRSSTVDLGDSEEPESIERLLTYVYHPQDIPSYDTLPNKTILDVDSIVFWNLDALRIADYFIMPGLRDVALKNLSSVLLISGEWFYQNPAGSPHFSRANLGLATFCAIARYVMVYPHEIIRARWVSMAALNWISLRTGPNCQEFQELIKEYPELCVDAMDLLHKDPGYQTKFQKGPRLPKLLEEFKRAEPGSYKG